MSDLLTPAERRAVRMAGELSTFITEEIISHGRTRDEDIVTLEFYVHGIQRMIMAQAAARALPGEFRLLGRECE